LAKGIYKSEFANILRKEYHRKLFSGIKNPMKKQEARKKISERMKKNNPMFDKEIVRNVSLKRKGQKRSLKTRQKMSNARMGKKISEESKLKIRKKLTGLKRSKETKDKMRKITINRMKNGELRNKDTQIELIVEKWLTDNNVCFVKQFVYEIGIADFFVPASNLIIECDGDYWHKYPYGTDRDKRQNEFLLSKGYNVLHLWENEIHKNKLWEGKLKCLIQN